MTVFVHNGRLGEAQALYRRLRAVGEWPQLYAMNALLNAYAAAYRSVAGCRPLLPCSCIASMGGGGGGVCPRRGGRSSAEAGRPRLRRASFARQHLPCSHPPAVTTAACPRCPAAWATW